MISCLGKRHAHHCSSFPSLETKDFPFTSTQSSHGGLGQCKIPSGVWGKSTVHFWDILDLKTHLEVNYRDVELRKKSDGFLINKQCCYFVWVINWTNFSSPRPQNDWTSLYFCDEALLQGWHGTDVCHWLLMRLHNTQTFVNELSEDRFMHSSVHVNVWLTRCV